MSKEHWENLDTLILVAGHAVYIADNFDRPADDGSWSLQPFQKGEAPFYIEHIRKGVEFADENKKALLVFSGGQTRPEAGPRSEAQSYWTIANHFHWWWRTGVSLRATTEEFARDSLENLLFGICRFIECAEHHPDRVEVVSWAFKEKRFAWHRQAIDFPLGKFKFRGVNNPVDLVKAEREEDLYALQPFHDDPYASGKDCEPKNPDGTSALDANGKPIVVNLKTKRNQRNPMRRTPPYSLSCPLSVQRLLQYQGTDMKELKGTLPWSEPEQTGSTA